MNAKLHIIVRGALYGTLCACIFWQAKILFVQAEAPVATGVPVTQTALTLAPLPVPAAAATSSATVKSEEAPSKNTKNTFTAKALYLAEIDPTKNSETVIFDKGSKTPLSIASITKLMTSYVALSMWGANTPIEITSKVVAEPWASKRFKGGEVLPLREIIEAMLVESNNDAARAVADAYDRNLFVARMNNTAESLGLSTMHFVNPEGTDPTDSASAGKPNISSAEDVAHLAIAFYKTFAQYAHLGSMETVVITDANEKVHHVATSTDTILTDLKKNFTVLLGKTGTTDSAQHTLVLIVTNNATNKTYVAVVLGSQDSFKDMKELLKVTNTY